MKNCCNIILLLTLGKLVGQVPVTWKDLVGVSVSGNTITKNIATGWTSGAASNEIIPANTDGYVEATIGSVGVYMMLGLSEINANASYTHINFAFYVNNTYNQIG